MFTQRNMDDVGFCVGDAEAIGRMAAVPPMPPFSTPVVDFLEAVSALLRADARARAFPAVTAFAFWCRRASLLEQKGQYYDLSQRMGRGMTFHIAPSNVPLNFAYSLAAGLLAGNACVVRLPSRKFEEVDLLCDVMRKLLDTSFCDLRPYVVCLRYGHDDLLTSTISEACDARVVWGGDATVRHVRSLPLNPRAVELCFPDRVSLCAIGCEAYLAAPDKDRIARDFYNDTLLNGQMACTAPVLVAWLTGAKDAAQARAAREAFWTRLHTLAERDYPMNAAEAVAKREAFCALAAAYPAARLAPGDNRIVRARVPEPTAGMLQYRAGGGFFIETEIETLSALLPVAASNCQTLACFGVERPVLDAFLFQSRPKGITRVAPLGRTMEFSLFWDGYDLIGSLSRRVVLGAV